MLGQINVKGLIFIIIGSHWLYYKLEKKKSKCTIFWLDIDKM